MIPHLAPTSKKHQPLWHFPWYLNHESSIIKEATELKLEQVANTPYSDHSDVFLIEWTMTIVLSDFITYRLTDDLWSEVEVRSEMQITTCRFCCFSILSLSIYLNEYRKTPLKGVFLFFIFWIKFFFTMNILLITMRTIVVINVINRNDGLLWSHICTKERKLNICQLK